jgi:hypothetical protein
MTIDKEVEMLQKRQKNCRNLIKFVDENQDPHGFVLVRLP